MEHVLSGEECGQSLLYFGCRRRDQDFLYGKLLEQWDKDGVIQLSTAFSREQVSCHESLVFKILAEAWQGHEHQSLEPL